MQIIERVECFKRRERIHVHLFERLHNVIWRRRAEQRKLLHIIRRRTKLVQKAMVNVRRFKLLGRGSASHAQSHRPEGRLAGQPATPKFLVHTPTNNAAQKNDVVPNLFYGNAVILDPCKLPLALCQFMIMRSEEGFSAAF